MPRFIIVTKDIKFMSAAELDAVDALVDGTAAAASVVVSTTGDCLVQIARLQEAAMSLEDMLETDGHLGPHSPACQYVGMRR